MTDGKKKAGQFSVGMIDKADQFPYLYNQDAEKYDLIKKKPVVAKDEGQDKDIDQQQSYSEYDEEGEALVKHKHLLDLIFFHPSVKCGPG